MPADQVERLIAAVIEEARAWTGRMVELPEGEGVALEIVRDKPWWASCDYLGALGSRVAVNVDLPCRPSTCSPSRSMRRIPATTRSVATRSTCSSAAAGCSRRRWCWRPRRSRAIGRALEPCRWAEVNAALMLHEKGASEAETQAYLERWALMTPKLAAHMIRSFTEPTSRTSIITYPAGRELCRSYVADEPECFRRLLTEQVRVRDLLEARAFPTGISSGR